MFIRGKSKCAHQVRPPVVTARTRQANLSAQYSWGKVTSLKHLATTQERWRSLISGVATNLLMDRSFTSSKPGPWRRGNVREVASCRGYEYHRSAPAVRIRMC